MTGPHEPRRRVAVVLAALKVTANEDDVGPGTDCSPLAPAGENVATQLIWERF